MIYLTNFDPEHLPIYDRVINRMTCKKAFYCTFPIPDYDDPDYDIQGAIDTGLYCFGIHNIEYMNEAWDILMQEWKNEG